MMNFFKQYQTVVVFLVVVGLIYSAYQFFFGTTNEQALSVTNVQAVGSVADQELIALLLELKGIRLDNAIFTDQNFVSLTDFSKDLVQEPVGRTNPFAPIDAPQPKKAGR